MEESRQKKIAELQERYKRQQEEQEKIAQAEEVIKQYLTPEALARYGNIKVAHPDIAMQVIAVIVNAIQQGKLRSKIDDYAFRDLLARLTQTHDIKIVRK